MAARTSSRQIAAREQARERAAAYAARERELVELAEEFFVADGEAGDIVEAAEARIASIRQQADRDVAETRTKAAEVAERMLATGTPAPQVADRLGMTVAELRRVRSAASKSVDESGAGDGVDDGAAVDASGSGVEDVVVTPSPAAVDVTDTAVKTTKSRVGALVG
ncbi:hypothetical protein [Kineococcus sp. R86509]|uniref:hypothetical protein n=1 Tax=Kineococcus sp. R86509 TaxID=3093851 RepID=UPI0036D40787